MTMNRRSFLRASGLAGGGLVLAYYFKNGSAVFAAMGGPRAEFAPNAFIRIAPDGVVSIFSHKPEIGQGIRTSLPMIVAEELDVAWESIKVVPGDLNPDFGLAQSAGGSNSTPSSYDTLRRMGAMARVMLIAAAANTWGVPAAECAAENGVVHHRASGKTLSYGQLAAKAATLPVPDAKSVPLKDPKKFKILGTRVGGVDNPAIVTGRPLFGIDVQVPDMLHAVFERCPVFGGRVVGANLDFIKSQPGVRDAFVVDGVGGLKDLVPGVAIVADNTWAAISARRQLKVVWDEGSHAGDNWADFATRARKAATGPGADTLHNDGAVAASLAGAAKVVEAAYSYPFISHANLEPQNCTALVQGNRAELWAPTQQPEAGQEFVARVLGIPRGNVKVHILRCGGGFGRRLSVDYMAEAAAIAKKAGVPVKLTWTREDDLRHDHFRPAGFHHFKGGIDASGNICAWLHHNVTFSSAGGRPGSGGGMRSGEFPAGFLADHRVEQTVLDCGIPMGPWRAPGSCVFGWVIQSFIDELAHAAGRDPFEFRLDLLSRKREGSYDAGRMIGVTKLAAEKAGWGKKLPKGRGQGIAFHFSHRGYFAEVAEVSVSPAGGLKVHRVVAAGDVGSQIVNLSGAENQVEGAIVDGLSAAWRQEVNIERGRTVQGNFDDYALLRIADAPEKIEIHFLKTDNPPTGLGEPALPPLAPAVCNAIFAATGRRIRELPFSKNDLRWS